MTTDHMAGYAAANKSYELATAEVEQMVRIVLDGAKKLGTDWRDVTFANVGSLKFPVGLRATITGDRWPTGLQLAETLSAWHAAKHALENAYRAIPTESRDMVKPPPD